MKLWLKIIFTALVVGGLVAIASYYQMYLVSHTPHGAKWADEKSPLESAIGYGLLCWFISLAGSIAWYADVLFKKR